MDLRLFEIFCAVYAEKSFSRAAEKLYLTQPTISQHIKTLEDYFGVKLFNRLGRLATPTRAGELLFQSGRAILDIKKATVSSMKKMVGRLEGELIIGASTIPGEYLVPKIMGQIRTRFSAIQIIERIFDSAGVIDAVSQGTVEIGFAGAQTPAEHLTFSPFAADQLILIAPNRGHWKSLRALTPSELYKQPLIIRERGSGTRTAMERKLSGLGKTLSDLHIIAEVGSTTALKETVKANLGVAFISSLAAIDEIKCGLLREIPVQGFKPWVREFFIVRDKRRASSPIGDAFLDFMLKSFK